jgi:hypothetical protein
MEYWNGAFLKHGLVLDLRLGFAEPLGPLLTGFPPWLRTQHRPGGDLLPPVREPMLQILQQKDVELYCFEPGFQIRSDLLWIRIEKFF